ncbi:DUF58 domain-containing protein [Halobacteria archaeon AArc-m2/3/4]|uniref:DUF58 domain-containing protein n=1 Tax=Natronoglomus mannanivorans TaxID=2979990 RepID=A0ABT2QDG6_9EURY|nr:DUF58 domain-containing protein [Halobacteria archaeon AArc-m2/3/4]
MSVPSSTDVRSTDRDGQDDHRREPDDEDDSESSTGPETDLRTDSSTSTRTSTNSSASATAPASASSSIASTTTTQSPSLPTGRWEVGLAVALVAVGIGIVAGNAPIFLSAVVGLSYAAYGYATRPPDPELTVTRVVDPESPTPGETVTVALAVTNEATEPVSDLRIVDEPPAGLEVEGSPKGATTLQPAETTTIEYTVRARRGTYDFGAVSLAVRNVSGSAEWRQRVALETSFDCDDALERVPLAGQTIQHTGRVETDVGGDGLEFYSIRSYHPTDPMSRVDWKRLARTGELTTVEFREERAASVVVVVDVREGNAVVRDEYELDGIALSKHAAGWIAGALLEENNRVGVALYGGRGDYLLPRTGRDQSARVRQLLEGGWHESFGRSRWLSMANRHVGRFCKHLDDEKQIMFVTPVLDEDPIRSARRFRAYGHAVTVVCPSVAHAETTGGTVERIDHRNRVRELREQDVRVIEWEPDESLHVAVERAKRRWSQ